MIASGSTDGRIAAEKLAADLGWSDVSLAVEATQTAERPETSSARTVVLFDSAPRVERLSVRESLSGKHLMLIA